MAAQPRLFEFRMGERSPDTLVLAEANREAAGLLAGWRAWPGGALALIGPPGSGKTHLALAWALETGGAILRADAPPEEAVRAFEASGGRVLVDEADGPHDDLTLTRLLDLARSQGGAALLVGESQPGQWRAELPDLRSRLGALAIARLGEPDQALLALVLRRLCRERFIELSQNALDYLAQNMGQSFQAAHSVAEALDGLVVRGRRPVNLALARRALAEAEREAGE